MTCAHLSANGFAGAISTAVEGEDYIMCVSPYPHIHKSPTNTCLYWLGRYADGEFDLQHAKGANTTVQTELASAELSCAHEMAA
jgi:hypothetical protein